MIYFDTSAVVPLLLPEPSSGAVQAWLARQGSAALALSEWTSAEVASALGLRFGTRVLTRVEAAAQLGLPVEQPA